MSGKPRHATSDEEAGVGELSTLTGSSRSYDENLEFGGPRFLRHARRQLALRLRRAGLTVSQIGLMVLAAIGALYVISLVFTLAGFGVGTPADSTNSRMIYAGGRTDRRMRYADAEGSLPSGCPTCPVCANGIAPAPAAATGGDVAVVTPATPGEALVADESEVEALALPRDDPRRAYLKDQPHEPVPHESGCQWFPPAEHAIHEEFFFKKINGEERAFQWQLLHVESQGAFLACPRSKPVMRILHAGYGEVVGFDRNTGRPLLMPIEAKPECLVDKTVFFTRHCNGARYCCLNGLGKSEGLPAPPLPPHCSKELGVSWQCLAPNEVLAEKLATDKSVVAGTVVTIQSLAGTNSTRLEYVAGEGPAPDAESTALVIPIEPREQRCAFTAIIGKLADGGVGTGLIHQFSVLTGSLKYAAASGCVLHTGGFLPDYDNRHTVPMSLIIDLDAWNQQMSEGHFIGPIEEELVNLQRYPWTSLQGNAGGHTVGGMVQRFGENEQKLFDFLEPVRKPMLRTTDIDDPDHPFGEWYLGHPFAMWIFQPPQHISRLRIEALKHLPFTAPFNQAVSVLKKEIGLIDGEYVVVHFRVEADSTEFAARHGMSVDAFKAKIYSFYENQLVKDVTDPNTFIYLSTGATHDDPWVQKLKQKFPNVRTKDLLLDACRPNAAPDSRSKFLTALKSLPWTSHTDECGLIRGDQYENREYWAAIDWMVARDAKYFLAWHGSMFSEMLECIIRESPKKWGDRVQRTVMLRT